MCALLAIRTHLESTCQSKSMIIGHMHLMIIDRIDDVLIEYDHMHLMITLIGMTSGRKNCIGF